MANFTRELAIEYATKGITVNAICPGTFRTPIADGVFLERGSETVKAFESEHPFGRLADPEEIRGPALFLAGNASSFMTGQMLTIDGGWAAQ